MEDFRELNELTDDKLREEAAKGYGLPPNASWSQIEEASYEKNPPPKLTRKEKQGGELS